MWSGSPKSKSTLFSPWLKIPPLLRALSISKTPPASAYFSATFLVSLPQRCRPRTLACKDGEWLSGVTSCKAHCQITWQYRVLSKMKSTCFCTVLSRFWFYPILLFKAITAESGRQVFFPSQSFLTFRTQKPPFVLWIPAWPNWVRQECVQSLSTGVWKHSGKSGFGFSEF